MQKSPSNACTDNLFFNWEVEQAVHFGVLSNYLTKTNYYTNRTMTTQRQWKQYDKDHRQKIVLGDVCSLTVLGTLWDHLARISMTRFLLQRPSWILMRNSPTETFIIYFISCLHSLRAPSPPARKLGINIQLRCTPVLKVTTVFPLLINYKHGPWTIAWFMDLIYVPLRMIVVPRQGVSMRHGQVKSIGLDALII